MNMLHNQDLPVCEEGKLAALDKENEDGEEFERLKDVIPSVAETDSSQVRIVREATRYIQQLQQEVADKLRLLGMQHSQPGLVTSPQWLATFLENQAVDMVRPYSDMTAQEFPSPQTLVQTDLTPATESNPCLKPLVEQRNIKDWHEPRGNT